MDNPKFFDKVIYELVVLASGLTAGGIFLGALFAILTGNLLFLIMSAVGIVAFKPLGTLRAKYRRAAEYDSSGQRVSMKDPMRMSKKDRDEMDKAKLFREQQICPTTTTDKMTHPGSETPDEDIARLIGLMPVKEKVADMTARMAFENRNRDKKKKKSPQVEVESRHMVFYGSPGTGKAQPLYSLVLTPKGFVRMGDIHEGDTVIAASGKEATVIGVFPQGVKPVYEVTLEDGRKCRCSDEHLWTVRLNGHYEYTTAELKDLLNVPQGIFIPVYGNGERKVRSIRFVGREECQCIYIDDAAHLYVTDDNIITHNTTIARIMAGYLYKYGYIKKNKCLEIDGNFLKAGEYSAEKTSIVIRRAMGGVLFIDEAYALMGDQAGAEAVATLIKEMEDHRGDFVLILAGYTNEMRQLLEYNPGFASRVKEYLTFPDYNAREMEEIFALMAKSKGFEVDSAAYPNFDTRVASERQLRSFGNARTARNILEETLDRHARNYMEGKLTESQEYLIIADDVSPEVKNTMFMGDYR